jgi:hypothetical protein
MQNNWNAVTVGQFIEIIELDTQELTPIEFQLERIAIVSGNDYFDTDESELSGILKEFRWLDSLPTNKTKQSFKGLSFGAFIDLNSYCTDKAPIFNIDKICATIRGFESITDECEKIQGESIVNHYSTIQAFIEYRSELLEKYKGLFEDDDPEPEDDDLKETEQRKPEQTNNKWGWQRLIYGLCDGDITKVKEVTELGHILVLNWLSMESELKLKG